MYVLLSDSFGLQPCEMLVYSADTNSWESRRTPDGFTPRLWPKVAWHSTRRRLYVFGGWTEAADLSELWVYEPDHNVWSELDPDGEIPVARASGSVAFDEQAGRLFLFGGAARPGHYLNDLWVYSIAENAWEELTPDGTPPEGRCEHSLAWDEREQALLVFGGMTGSSLRSDLMAYHARDNQWAVVGCEGPGPAPRSHHGACWDALGRNMYIFGGANGGKGLNDLWAYTPATRSWRPLEPANSGPGPRWGQQSVWNGATGQLYVFGGQSMLGAHSQLWAYTPE
jgi:N-acetylneuraminic acid mutarotase